MPCVLPVLAIKLASIIASSGIDRSLVRLRFISGACGIISSFLLLASVIALIRLTGGHIGWGVQFQSVSFLAISTLVIGLFGFIMLDYISIPVPNFVQTGAGSIFFKSSKQDAGPLVTDFAAGVFATLLATPCSAPFVVARHCCLYGKYYSNVCDFLYDGIGAGDTMANFCAFSKLRDFFTAFWQMDGMVETFSC